MDEGLVVVRTLAILEIAAERKLIDLRQALMDLDRTTFRIDRQAMKDALERQAKRNRQDSNLRPAD